MHCSFDKRQISNGIEVKLGDLVIPQVDKFRYLESITQKDCEIDRDINNWILVGWFKWKKAIGVMCDRKVQVKVKGKFYRKIIRPAMLHSSVLDFKG